MKQTDVYPEEQFVFVELLYVHLLIMMIEIVQAIQQTILSVVYCEI